MFMFVTNYDISYEPCLLAVVFMLSQNYHQSFQY